MQWPGGLGKDGRCNLKALHKRAASLLCAVLLLPTAGLSAAASGAFDSYVYDTDREAVSAPDAVTLAAVYTGQDLGVGALASASDICTDADGRLYIADTGNNRIVVLGADERVERTIDGFTDAAGVRQHLAAPQGVFVHDDGRVYIADTGNQRIVILNADGTLERLVGAPESSVLAKDFVFKPTKLAVDTADRIFVVSSGFNMGLLQLDKHGNFVQCLGAPKVTYTLWEYIWNLFSTEAQRARSASFVPTEYNNVTIDGENFLFVTSSSYDMWEYLGGGIQPLKRLNAKGDDILRKNGNGMPYGDTEVIRTGSYRGPSTLVDAATMGYGMYAILDANRSRVFVYNSDGELLFMFGGPGEKKGAFRTPSSFAFVRDSFYILDSTKQTLTRYTMNDYGKQLYEATACHDRSEYDREQEIWQAIADENINQSAALVGIGKAAYRNKDYTEAMRLFRLAEDKTNYSKAYQKYRSDWVGENFGRMMAVLAAVIAAVLVYRAVRRRRGTVQPDIHSYRGTLRYARHMSVHPLEGAWDLKRERRGSMAAAMTLLGLCCVAMLLYDCFTGFIFCGVKAEERNLLLEFAKVLGPFFLFCACNWCVTSLIGGEGSFRDIVMAAAYSLTPLVILLPIATLFSHVLTLEERDFYIVFVVLAVLWAAGLLICSNKQIHNYSMGRAIGILLLTVLVMLIVVFLMVLAFVLVQQFVSFVSDIIDELYLR